MTKQRLQNKFSTLKAQNRAALITYIMAYAPNYKTSMEILKGLPQSGADIIELGLPFSDPMADGPIIQEAAYTALNSGAKMKGILEMIADFRKDDDNTPIVLMGYYNTLQNYGLDKFSHDASSSGVDGILIVDLPPEEEEELKLAAEKEGLAWIRLVAPTSNEERIKTIVKSASGFVYYVAVSGVTGAKSASSQSIEEALIKIKKHTNLPVVVGFGIKSASDVREISKVADGVVVGSAIVKNIMQNNVASTLALVKELSSGL